MAHPHCLHCDYDLAGVSPTRGCPECGRPVWQSLELRAPWMSGADVHRLDVGFQLLAVSGLTQVMIPLAALAAPLLEIGAISSTLFMVLVESGVVLLAALSLAKLRPPEQEDWWVSNAAAAAAGGASVAATLAMFATFLMQMRVPGLPVVEMSWLVFLFVAWAAKVAAIWILAQAVKRSLRLVWCWDPAGQVRSFAAAGTAVVTLLSLGFGVLLYCIAQATGWTPHPGDKWLMGGAQVGLGLALTGAAMLGAALAVFGFRQAGVIRRLAFGEVWRPW